MLVARYHGVVLQGPDPFVAVGVAAQAEEVRRTGFALGVVFAAEARIVGFEGVAGILGQRERLVGVFGGLFEESPVQADAGFESVGAHAAQTGRAVGRLVVPQRQEVEHLVFEILVENLVDDFGARRAGVAVAQPQHVIDVGNVAVELAAPFVDVSAREQQFGLVHVVLLFAHQIAHLVDAVEHEVGAGRGLVDVVVDLFDPCVVGGKFRLLLVVVVGGVETRCADVAGVVLDAGERRRGGVDQRQTLVGGEYARLHLRFGCGEGQCVRAVEIALVERAACGEESAQRCT